MDSISLISNSTALNQQSKKTQSQNSGQNVEDGFSVIFNRDREEAVAKRVEMDDGSQNTKGIMGSRKGKLIRYTFCGALLILLVIGLIGIAFWHSKQQEVIDAHKLALLNVKSDSNWMNLELNSQSRDLEQESLKEAERLELIKLQNHLLELTSAHNASTAQRLENTNEAVGLCKSALENATELYSSSMWEYFEVIQKYYHIIYQLRNAGQNSDVLQNHLKSIGKATNDSQNQNEELSKKLAEKEREIGQIEGQIAEHQANVVSLNRTFFNMTAELDGINSLIEEKDKKINKLEELLTQARIEKEEGEMATNYSIIAELREQLEQRGNQVNQLELLTNEQQNVANKNLELHSESASQIHEWNMAGKEDTLKELQDKINKLNAKIEDKQKTLDAKWVEISRMERCRYSWWCW